MKFVLLDELKKNKCFEFRINRPFPQHQTFTVIALLMTEISCISCNSYCYKSANTYLLNHIYRCFVRRWLEKMSLSIYFMIHLFI